MTLKQLLEKANKNENMQWRVYAFDPEQDNKLVYTSKVFDCICQAQKDKLLQLDKHPNYTVEISTMRVEESAQKNESSEEFAEGLLAAAKILKSKGFSEDKHMQAGLMGSTYRKGSHLISIGLYNGNQVQVDTYDETQGEDTFVKNWNLDRVRMSDIVSAAQSALKSLNESSRKNEAPELHDESDVLYQFELVRRYIERTAKLIKLDSRGENFDKLSAACGHLSVASKQYQFYLKKKNDPKVAIPVLQTVWNALKDAEKQFN